MKKLLTLVLTLVLALGAFVGCGNNGTSNGTENGSENASTGNKVKVGFIFLHDESSTYDKNFIDAAKLALEAAGLTSADYIMKTNIDEKEICYETAADLADQGCNLIFADSFGHEEYIIRAAREFPDVQFCHATGVKAHTEDLPNYHNAFATIYEGRYLAGVAAGLKIKSMIDAGTKTVDEAKIGYVGAFPYAEVISGFTSFYLGAKSIVPEVTMTVRYTNSWYNPDSEKTTALSLIDEGCILISQHADSLGAPSACEENGVPNVSYNGSTKTTGPNTYIISSRINWQPYFEYIINAVKNGTAISTDYIGTIATDSVQTLELNTAVAATGTQDKLDEVLNSLKAGTLKVFDTSKFTVNGEVLTTYKADVDDDGTFVGETEAIKTEEINGTNVTYFAESEYRSAPYFDIIIDGITSITNG